MGTVTNEAHTRYAKDVVVLYACCNYCRHGLGLAPEFLTNAHPEQSVLPANTLVQQGYMRSYHVRTLSLQCVKLSPTFQAAPGRCGEARGEATHLRDLVPSSLIVYKAKLPYVHFAFV